MIIPREHYLNRLLHYRGNGRVKIITGLRRAGKSFLLFKLFKDKILAEGVKENHILEYHLDDNESMRLRNPIVLHEDILARAPQDAEKTYVLIDEVQLCSKVRVDIAKPGQTIAAEDEELCWVSFQDVLNSLIIGSKFEVYVTGSNSRLLSKDIVTQFRGRSTEIQVFPLSFGEIASLKSSSDKLDTLRQYLTFGGLPEVVLENDVEAKKEVLWSIYEKTYIKDVIARHGIEDSAQLHSLLEAVCSSIGSLTNCHRLYNTLKARNSNAISEPTISKFLKYLADAYMLMEAKRYDVRGRRYLNSTVKYYAMDLGIRNAILGFREMEMPHLMENAIYLELIRRGCSVDIGIVEIREEKNGSSLRKQLEIDFVVNAYSSKIYIQSAYSIENPQQKAREKRPLALSNDFCRKYIVDNGYMDLSEDCDGILNIGLIPFLLDENILKP